MKKCMSLARLLLLGVVACAGGMEVSETIYFFTLDKPESINDASGANDSPFKGKDIVLGTLWTASKPEDTRTYKKVGTARILSATCKSLGFIQETKVSTLMLKEEGEKDFTTKADTPVKLMSPDIQKGLKIETPNFNLYQNLFNQSYYIMTTDTTPTAEVERVVFKASLKANDDNKRTFEVSFVDLLYKKRGGVIIDKA